jgi:hypothetical protein
MSESIIIVDNYFELKVIEKQYPELKNTPLILLSRNFLSHHLESFEGRGYTWFDESITKIDEKQISNDIHYLLWNWFLDEKDNDISLIDGCSLGSAFASSLEILANSTLKYLVGLGNILNKNSHVYYSSLTEDIFRDVIIYLKENIGFSSYAIKSNDIVKFKQQSNNQKVDANLRYRNLSPNFLEVKLKEKVVSYFLPKLQKRKRKRKKQILFMSAGKQESFVNYVSEVDLNNNYSWILPFSQSKDLLALLKNRSSFFYLCAKGPQQSEIISDFINNLKLNILQRIDVINPNLLINIMSRYIFIYFQGALNYFRNAQEIFKELKPSLAVFSADTYETFILAAQAAKKENIATALIPHGLYGWGYKEYKKGRFNLFDYYFAFGNVDKVNFLNFGVEKERVFLTPFPYYEKFLPIKVNRQKENYSKVLILAPEISNVSPDYKIGNEYRFYHDVCRSMQKIKKEVIGIKMRDELHAKSLGLKSDNIEINGQNIPLIFGYTSFPEALIKSDFVIGPCSTAIIEAGLLGFDYYLHIPTRTHELVDSLPSGLHRFINTSHNMEQLINNIKDRKPYQDGCSVYDLAYIKGINNKEELFENFLKNFQPIVDLLD